MWIGKPAYWSGTGSMSLRPRACGCAAGMHFRLIPGIVLHFDEVPFPDAPGRLWGAFGWEPRASRMPGRA